MMIYPVHLAHYLGKGRSTLVTYGKDTTLQREKEREREGMEGEVVLRGCFEGREETTESERLRKRQKE